MCVVISLHNMFICRTVGDCNLYDMFFEKQCNEENPEAMRMKNEIDIFVRTDTVINKSLDGSRFDIYFGLFDKSVMWCAIHDHGKFMIIMHM